MRRTLWTGTGWIGTWIGLTAVMGPSASAMIAEEPSLQGPEIIGLTELERARVDEPVSAAWKHALRWLEFLDLDGLEVVAPTITVHGTKLPGSEIAVFPTHLVASGGEPNDDPVRVEGWVGDSMLHALRRAIGRYVLDSVVADPPPRAIEEGFAEVFALSCQVAGPEAESLVPVLDLLHVATCLAEKSDHPDPTWRFAACDWLLDRMDRIDDLRRDALGWSIAHAMCFGDEPSTLATTIRRFAADLPPETSWRTEFGADRRLTVATWTGMLATWENLPWRVRPGDRRGWFGFDEESLYYRNPAPILPKRFGAEEYLPSPKLTHRNPKGMRRGMVTFGPISTQDPFRVVLFGARTTLLPRFRIENDLEQGVLRVKSTFDWTVKSEEWAYPSDRSVTVGLTIEDGEAGEGDHAVWRVGETTFAHFPLEEWEGLRSLQIEQGGGLREVPIKIIDRS